MNHGLERLALVAHVSLGNLHEIRDQVVSSLELNVDLAECVLVTVPQADERVERPDRVQDEQNDDHDHAQQGRGGG